MSLSAKWFVGVAQEDRVSHEQLIRNSTILLGTLTKVIEEELAALRKPPSSDYDSPAWAYKQADRNGQIRVLTNLLSMTQLRPQRSE